MNRSHYRPAVGVSARRFGHEVVVLDVVRGVYFAINGVGTHVWEALLAGDSLDEIPATLAARFDVDAGTARRDVDAFIETLLTKRLIEIAGEPEVSR